MPSFRRRKGQGHRHGSVLPPPSRGQQDARRDTLKAGQVEHDGGKEWVGHLWILCPDQGPRNTDLGLGPMTR